MDAFYANQDSFRRVNTCQILRDDRGRPVEEGEGRGIR